MSELAAGMAATLACSLLWAVLDVLRKQLVARVELGPLVVWLALSQAPLLAPWAATADPSAITEGYGGWALASVAVNVLANVLYLFAVGSGQFSIAIPLLAFVPVWTAVLAVPLLGQLPTPLQGLGIAMVVAGAVALTGGGRRGLVALVREPASVAMLGVAFAWSLTIVLDKRATTHAPVAIHALVLSLGIAAGGTAWRLVQTRGRVGEVARGIGRALAAAPGRIAAAGAVAAAAMALQLLAIQSVPVSVLESVKRTLGMGAALVFGRVLFGERIDRARVIAIAVMAAGAVLVLQQL
ncbi:MAG: DMT family transporter [Nannocystaceae bacterium]|nr:DMT family transporter [Nannocystaceae bacterium]